MSADKIKALIVDDSAQARKLLRLMLAEVAHDVEVTGEAANAASAVQHIKATPPDVVFMDIEMPGKSGLQLAEELSNDEVPFGIVFTTAYNQYAIRAFRLAAIDYLLKPIEEQQLAEAVDKIRNLKTASQTKQQLQALISNLKSDTDATISLPALNGYLFQRVADILYIKANGSYTQIYAAGKQPVTVSRNLKYFETALADFKQFVRVHRSYLINVQQMKRFDKAERGIIVMNDDAAIDLARDRRDVFFKTIGK